MIKKKVEKIDEVEKKIQVNEIREKRKQKINIEKTENK